MAYIVPYTKGCGFFYRVELIFIQVIFQSRFAIENMIIDADTLPPYLPERKGYITLLFKGFKNGIMEDVCTFTVFFEVENTGIIRFKNRTKTKN